METFFHTLEYIVKYDPLVAHCQCWWLQCPLSAYCEKVSLSERKLSDDLKTPDSPQLWILHNHLVAAFYFNFYKL